MQPPSKEARHAKALKGGTTWRAQYEAWLAQMEEREGLLPISVAASRIGRLRTCVKDAVEAGHLPSQQVDCPPRGKPLLMVRMEDIAARYGKR
jgi:hypothetical protein